MKCDDCGKFMSADLRGVSWAELYDFNPAAYGLDHTHYRCRKCTKKFGAVESNAKPANGDMTPYQGVL